jgi:hypothetical protein
MLKKSRVSYHPFSSPLPETFPSTAAKWSMRVARPSRFSGLRLTPARIGILILLTCSLVVIHDWVPKLKYLRVSCGFSISEATLLTAAASAYYRHRKHDNYPSSRLPTARIRIIQSPRHHRHVSVLQIPQCVQCLFSRPTCAIQSTLSGPGRDAYCNVIRWANWT